MVILYTKESFIEKKLRRNFNCLKMVLLVIWGGGKISPGKRDLFAIPQDLPPLLQTSPGTNGMPKNLLRPESSTQWVLCP